MHGSGCSYGQKRKDWRCEAYNLVMIRPRLVSVCLAASLLQGCTKTASPPAAPPENKPSQSTTNVSPVAQLLQRRLSRRMQNEVVSSQDALARMKSASVLYPDRRFVQAFAAVHLQITQQGSVDLVDATLKEGKWQLSYKGEEIGSVSELASFDELYKLLTSWTQRLVDKHHFQVTAHGAQLDLEHANVGVSTEIRIKISKMSPKNLIEALSVLSRIWNSGEHSADVLTSSAQALSLLCWQSLDTMEINDSLSSQALAMVSLSEITCKSQLTEDKLLLADAFGYETSVRSLSAQVKPDSVFAIFGKHDFEQLQRLAARPDSSTIEQYAYLKALCARRDRPALKKWLKDFAIGDASYSMSVLNAIQKFGIREVEMPVALQMLGTCSTAVKNGSNYQISAADLEWSDPEVRMSKAVGLLGPGLLETFEKSVEQLNAPTSEVVNASSRFLTSTMLANYYRSYFFSAVGTIVRSTLSLQSSRLFLQRIHECLQLGKSGPSSQLAPWVMAVNAFNSGKANVEDLQKVLIDLDSLNGTAMGTLMLLGANLPSSFDLMFSAPELFIARVDSRPTMLPTITQVAERPMMDLGLYDRVSKRSLSGKAPNSIQSEILLNKHAGNADYLLKLLASDTLTIAEKLSILHFVEGRKRDVLGLSGHYQKIMDKSPKSWLVANAYVEMLVRCGKFESAIKVLRTWIASNRNVDEARVLLASMLHDVGRYKESAEVLKSLKNCSLPSYLRLLALNAMQAGEFKQAEAWSEELSRSYPHDVRSLLVALSIDCKQKAYQNAAAGLKNARLSREDWKIEVGPTILTYTGSDDDVLQFAKALKEAQIYSPNNLGQIAAAAYQADRADLAFRILSEVNCPEEMQPDFYTLQYRYLKRAKGKEAALAWLSKVVPPAKRTALAPFAFFSGQDELLFDFMSAATDDGKADPVWLLRAAATVVDGAETDVWKKKIGAHFALEDNLESRIALYLLNEYNRARLLSEPLSVRDRTVASFFTAWKELSVPGDFLEDTEWLRLCLMGNQSDLSEYRWAQVWLRDTTNTLITKRASFSEVNLKALHVASPSFRHTWDEQRRFTLTTKH